MKLDPLHVIAFPGAPNLPLFAAVEQGLFAAEGLDLSLELTPNSVHQARQAAAGAAQIVCTAFDNVVAYTEGQGAAGEGVNPGYVVAMGATQLELSLVVDPAVESYADLEGRSIALDALTTGFAFVLHAMLERGGVAPGAVDLAAVGATPQRWQSVREGQHSGTLTIEPFTSLARTAGFRVLDTSSRLFDSYQGGVIATTRAFAAAHPERVRGFLRASLKGLSWVLDPANRDAATELLAARMPEIRPQAMAAVMASLLSPRSGLTPGGAILPQGMRTVLDLRSRHGGGGILTDIEKYLDLRHYETVRVEA